MHNNYITLFIVTSKIDKNKIPFDTNFSTQIQLVLKKISEGFYKNYKK